MELALTGGDPVWTKGWPAWPQTGAKTGDLVADVLGDERWAVSGEWTGRRPFDMLLAERFAQFVGARWCVPVDHGSSALLAGIFALGVEPGQEVIVPGLTWVACASVVARAGAVPILVDVDPRTLCVDPAAVQAAIGPRTAAIMAVHLYSAMADMDALRAIADANGLPLIEDAAQAHGAAWRGAGAGSLGTFGAFSTQQGKTLASGEGGLFVTSDPMLRDRVEMLRGDGRRYGAGPFVVGRPDLEEMTVLQGWNMHLSELQAALLIDGLERLTAQNETRAKAAAQLDAVFGAWEELRVIEPYVANDKRAYYHYAVRLTDGAFAGRDAREVAEALSAELGFWIHLPYRALSEHPLYDPRRLPGHGTGEVAQWLDPRRFELPQARRAAADTLLLHHPMLLADKHGIDAIIEAFDKVRRLADRIPRSRTDGARTAEIGGPVSETC